MSDGIKAMLGREISQNIVWPTCKDHEEDSERVFIYLSDHDRIVAELKSQAREPDGWITKEFDSKNKTIAQLRAELETARRVREKLTEQRNFYRVCARDEYDAKLAAKTDDAEIAAIERGET